MGPLEILLLVLILIGQVMLIPKIMSYTKKNRELGEKASKLDREYKDIEENVSYDTSEVLETLKQETAIAALRKQRPRDNVDLLKKREEIQENDAGRVEHLKKLMFTIIGDIVVTGFFMTILIDASGTIATIYGALTLAIIVLYASACIVNGFFFGGKVRGNELAYISFMGILEKQVGSGTYVLWLGFQKLIILTTENQKLDPPLVQDISVNTKDKGLQTFNFDTYNTYFITDLWLVIKKVGSKSIEEVDEFMGPLITASILQTLQYLVTIEDGELKTTTQVLNMQKNLSTKIDVVLELLNFGISFEAMQIKIRLLDSIRGAYDKKIKKSIEAEEAEFTRKENLALAMFDIDFVNALIGLKNEDKTPIFDKETIKTILVARTATLPLVQGFKGNLNITALEGVQSMFGGLLKNPETIKNNMSEIASIINGLKPEQIEEIKKAFSLIAGNAKK